MIVEIVQAIADAAVIEARTVSRIKFHNGELFWRSGGVMVQMTMPSLPLGRRIVDTGINTIIYEVP